MNKEIKIVTERWPIEELLSNVELWSNWGDIPPLSEPSFFSDREVVLTWLKTLPLDYEMIISFLYQSEKLVGIALLGEFKEFIGRVIPVKKISLLRSGVSHFDQWWPEYVQPRLDKDSHHLWGDWMHEIIKQTKADFLDTEVVPLDWLREWEQGTVKLSLEVSNVESGGIVDLKTETKFSKSTIRQYKQTSKFSKNKWGLLKLERLEADEIEGALSSYSFWHINKWVNTETESGFKNKHFEDVLNGLAFLKGEIGLDVYLASVNGDVLGMQVMLSKDDWAGFYLSSLHHEESNHWHLGTWMHIEIIKELKIRGFSSYDFMAGNARYKKQLSTEIPLYAKGEWSLRFNFRSVFLRSLKKLVLSGNIIKNKLTTWVIK